MRVDVVAEEVRRGVFGRLEVEVRGPVARVLSSARGSSSSVSVAGSVLVLWIGFLGACDVVVDGCFVVVSESSVSRPSNIAESSASVGLVFLVAIVGRWGLMSRVL